MFAFRSLYLRIFTGLAPFITLLALWQLMQGQWQWLAPLLAWAPFPLLNLWRRFKGNVGYRDERERLVMTLTLMAVALGLIAGQRDLALWFTLAGLFGLLLFLFVASALPRGLREQAANLESLPDLTFKSGGGEMMTLGPLQRDGHVLVLFFHSVSQVYSVMALRELQQWLEQGRSPIAGRQIVAVFPGEIPAWSEPIQSLGVKCWQDRNGDSLKGLGLWLRGGNTGFNGGSHAARPTLALLKAGQNNPLLWQQSDNFRLPPSVQDLQPKIERLIKQA